MNNRQKIAMLLGAGAVAAVVSNRVRRASKVLLYPVANPRITSGYGTRKHPVTGATSFHNGIDLAGPIGQVIAAPADGVVLTQYSNAAGGIQMTVKHDNGFTTGYAHLSKYAVKTGERVSRSQVIAYIGNTGQSTGPHLHFTVRDESGNLIDPATVLS